MIRAALCTTALAIGLAGCSLSGLDDLEVASCTRDDDCSALNVSMGLGSDACAPFVCNVAIGRCEPGAVDVDGDGESPVRCGGLDCNDQSAAIGLGAVEVCNGVDDDCDGRLDGPDEDDDGDGMSDRCAGAAARDCDDDDPSTYYDAPELCDGFDNDCLIDGFRRAGGGRQRELAEDRDGDGHVSMDALCQSEAPPGSGVSLLPADDCADDDPAAYAGALEVCGAVDNDCDGVVSNRDGGAEGTACNPRQMRADAMGVCVLDPAEQLVCWGNGALRAMDTTPPRDLTPPGIEPSGTTARSLVRSGLGSIVDFDLADEHACAIDARGEARCWGGPWFQGVLGNGAARGTIGSTTAVDELDGASRIASAGDHTCVVRDGAVLCWGQSAQGECGAVGDADTPRVVEGVADVIDVDVGVAHSCALRGDGAVVCWGATYRGQLGNGIADHATSGVPPTAVEGIDDAVDVVTGASHTCVRTEAGGVRCFGADDFGQVGDGAPFDAAAVRARPIDVVGLDGSGTLTGIVEVAAGTSHTCARADGGAVYCWGRNDRGQLGDGTTASGSVPRRVMGLDDAVGLALGSDFSCAQRRDHRPVCWGANDGHQLGDGTAEDRATPVAVQVITDFRELRMSHAGVCARSVAGSWSCPHDERVAAMGALRDLALGVDHTCAIDAAGDVHCWGSNASQQLGVEGLTESETPVRLEGLPPMRAIAAMHDFMVRPSQSTAQVPRTLSIDEDGGLWTWGAEPGSGCVARRTTSTPERVPGLPPVAGVSVGPHETCAVGEDGSVWCWGCGLFGVTEEPRRVIGVRGAVEVGVGYRYACARMGDGAVECWGSNEHGTLGDTGGDRPLPLPVQGVRAVSRLDVGPSMACARVDGGAMRCWGDNVAEIIAPSGTAGTTVRAPREVDGVPAALDMRSTGTRACAIRDSTQVVCWGGRSYYAPPQATTGWY